MGREEERKKRDFYSKIKRWGRDICGLGGKVKLLSQQVPNEMWSNS